MTNVVNLHGKTSGLMRDEDRQNPELIAGLEELLEEAKAGRLIGGLYVFANSRQEQLTAIFARDISNVELLGISALSREMVSDFVREA